MLLENKTNNISKKLKLFNINLTVFLVFLSMSILSRYFYKLLISWLIIIIFYNIFFILFLLFNHNIEGFLLKSWNYSPYKHSELFKKSYGYSKKDPRNSEMNDVFEKYFSLNASIPIVTLTPSIYNIKKNEIFNSYTS